MDQKSLQILEFPKVREVLAGFTAFSVSRELAETLLPSHDAETVCLWLRQSAEARWLLSLEPGFSIGHPGDIRKNAKMTTLGKILDPESLLDIRSTLATARLMHSTLKGLLSDLPCLWDIARNIVVIPSLEEEIERCIDPAGEVLDTASEELARIKYELKETRRQIINRLESIIRAESAQVMVQDNFITERSGRYVIPIKTEFQGEMKGIIHDVSNTGATVFIEPWATVELGNKLRQLDMEEEREIGRILTELSEEVAENNQEISENVNLIAELDLALAKARYARSVKATEAQIADTDGEKSGILKLINARHPLLKERAVPISVEAGDGFTGLIITGPNTGGKTVSLKTMGLLTLMTQSGMPIPASEGSQVPIFDNVFADIGDEQSIEETLSSFSWHMGNVVRIVGMSTTKSLVLLDELGTSTDPAEGAALARAILHHFLSREVLFAATSHYSELKVFAHATSGLQNASMEFDPKTLAPTFNLVLGIPGGSNALAIASQLGLPSAIIESAREMLPQGASEMEVLLRELASEKEATQAIQMELAKDREAAAKLKLQIEEEIRGLESAKHEILQEERERIGKESVELHKRIREASSELKKTRSKKSVKEAKSVLDAVREKLSSKTWQTETDREQKGQEIAAPPISIGDEVRVADTNIRGKVIAQSKKTGQIEIHAGQTKIRVDVEDVEKVESEERSSSIQSHTLQKSEEQRHRSLELDLRGKRADEVEPELDSYLNDVSIARFHEVCIVHGYGTGTIRQIVRDMLASHPLVRSFRSGKHDEGGDGVTVARL